MNSNPYQIHHESKQRRHNMNLTQGTICFTQYTITRYAMNHKHKAQHEVRHES